jgi:head-tail adaptor
MTGPHLSQQLVLEAAQRSPDGAGGFSATWIALGMHWAQITPGTGRETGKNGLPLSRPPLRIVVRAAPVANDRRPLPGQRFRQGTRFFAIEAVTALDPNGRYLICRATEEVAS